MTDNIEIKVCKILGGDEELRKFEHKWNPVKLLAEMRYGLKMDKEYANMVSSLYQRLYNDITDKYVKDNYHGIMPQNTPHKIGDNIK